MLKTYVAKPVSLGDEFGQALVEKLQLMVPAPKMHWRKSTLKGKVSSGFTMLRCG